MSTEEAVRLGGHEDHFESGTLAKTGMICCHP